ncbi:MAG: lipopolysaccharide biosynthesis protein [Clostridium sp.]
MRTKNAIKNIGMSLFSQIVILILGFVSRKVFIDNLGAEYLGVNGLLTNVLSMMVLIEGGIGISIVYNLYKPLAENNKDEIIALVQLYKKAYKILALIMLIISCGLYPLLGFIMKSDEPIKGMFIVYVIFVAKNIISYVNAYKWALINADQKGYVLARSNLIFQIITTISKIMILIVTKSYIVFLLIEVTIFILQNITNTIIVYKRYPYLREKTKYSIDGNTKENINKNVRAMFLHNIGGYLVFSTDNILISTFISVKAVGLYSNYTMIIGQLAGLLSHIIDGIGAGVGNLIAIEGEEKTYSIFQISYFVSFWIYSFSTIFLYVLLQPFINWWIGDGYLLDEFTFIIILVNFYLNGMRGPIATFKNKGGMFVQDKYVPLIEGLINLIGALILIKYLGLVGVFLGTTISTLVTVFWNQPRIVYKNLFKVSVKSYFIKYTIYILITIFTGTITVVVCNLLIRGDSFASLIGRGIICVSIINLIYILIFFKTKEFKAILNLLQNNLLSSGFIKRFLRK